MNQPFTIYSINSHHYLIRWFMLCWIISLYAGLAKADLSRLDQQDLTPNTLFERHISGGQTDNYTIALVAGQGIKIKVEQRGVDIYLMLSGPDGRVLIKENGWQEPYGTELIVWAAKIEGIYQLQIGAVEKQAGAGNYGIKLEITPADERFVSAIEKFNVGLQSEKEKQPEQALGSFEQSIKIWQALGDREMTARALYSAAYFAYELSLLPKAMDYSLQALEIFRSLGMQREEYTVLSVVAFSYGATGDIPKALHYERQRIPLLSVVSPQAAINLHLNLGINSRRIGDHKQAEEYLNEALRRARDLKLPEEELLALSALATLYYVTNEPLRSIESINAALPLSRELKQPIREGRLLLQLGQIYARAAEPQQAINFFNQALQLTDTVAGRTEHVGTLIALGETLAEIGNTASAFEAFNKALTLTRTTGLKALEMRALTRIGVIVSESGENEKALEYQHQASNFFRTNGLRNEECSVLIDLARTYQRLGQKQKTRELLEQALTLVRGLAGRGSEAEILRQLALLASDEGDLANARELIEAALHSREQSRNKFTGPSLKTSYSASSQDYYETYLDILMRLHQISPKEGYEALALSASEQAKARGLLDLLAEARADIQQGADPALLEKERNLLKQLNAKDTAYRDLINNTRTVVSAEIVAKEINELAVQLQLVEAQLRASSPHYTALTQPQTLKAAEIQHLLDDDTVLLEFALGEKQSWLWAVTPNQLSSFPLPARSEIEAAARMLYQIFTAPQPRPQESSLQYAKRVAENNNKLLPEARVFSQMLLSPIAAKLSMEWKGKRLVVVSSGALDYLPFSALPVPTLNGKADDYHPLILDHEIVNLPSVSVLAAIRQQSDRRHKPTNLLAILADPVFQANDPRAMLAVKRRETAGRLVSRVRSADASAITTTINPAQKQSVKTLPRSGFAQLPFSRTEAETISALIPKTRLFKAMGFKASRTTAMSGKLADYRIVHFATHGLVNSRHPELSGLVLSLFDENGKEQDGFLRMHEIYNLKLPTELVVLSACQTAVGKEIKGEGLVGLTRGFIYAGAMRVVASLWQVDDIATAELMKLFYRRMLVNKMTPAAALRAAQIEMLNQKHRSLPYFWAAFTLQGEWQ